VNIAELSPYAYFALTVFLVVGLYGYIFHLYTKRKDAEGKDYEEYSNMALHDDIGATPVKPVSRDKEK
jgi:cytochrome c oxidase cbb3-type subunit 4